MQGFPSSQVEAARCVLLIERVINSPLRGADTITSLSQFQIPPSSFLGFPLLSPTSPGHRDDSRGGDEHYTTRLLDGTPIFLLISPLSQFRLGRVSLSSPILHLQPTWRTGVEGIKRIEEVGVL